MTMHPLLNWLGLGQPRGREYERHQARLVALQRGMSMLQQEQQRGTLLPGVAADLREEYQRAMRQEQEELEALELKPGFVRSQQIRQTRRQALLTQRSALLELSRQGQLSAEALHDLLEEVDTELVQLGDEADDAAVDEPAGAGREAGREASRGD
jgi:hypothetical protein